MAADADHAAAVARWRTVAGSPANRGLHRLRDLLRQVEEEAERWAEEHARGCGCPYCGPDPDAAEHLLFNLAGIRWAAVHGGGILDAVTLPLPDRRRCRLPPSK